MKKKVLFSIIFAMIFTIIATPVVNAFTIDGYTSSHMYGIDFRMRNGWNNGSYGQTYNWGGGIPVMPSNPYPFDYTVSPRIGTNFIMALSNGSYSSYSNIVAYTGAFCIGWGVPFGEYSSSDVSGSTKMSEYPLETFKRTRNGDKLDAEGIRAVKYALTYGYTYPTTSAQQVRNLGSVYTFEDGVHAYGAAICGPNQAKIMATQILCWMAVNKHIDKDDNVAVLKDYFFERSWHGNGEINAAGVEGIFDSYRSKIVHAMKMPSFGHPTRESAISNKIELKWNADNQRFEYTITDTNNMYAADKVAISFSNTGDLNVEDHHNGSYTIWTKKVVGSQDNPYVFNAVKTISEGKGLIVVAKAKNSDSQPVAIPTNDPIVESNYLSAYTQAIKVRVEKVLDPITDNGLNAFGDAYVKDCQYTVYRNPECTDPVETITIQENGLSNKTQYLPYQKYWVKETKANESTRLNEQVYEVDPATFALDEEGDIVVKINANDKIVPSGLRLIKFWDQETSDKCPAEGAEFTLTLVNNEAETYTTHIDADGRAEFTNIPWGTYRLSEPDSNSEKYLEVQDEEYELKKDKDFETVQLLILGDNWFECHITLRKIDATTKKPITLRGAKFRIYDVEKEEWVSLNTTNGFISEFETNDEGSFTTPEKLRASTYRIYETQAPLGYKITPELEIPEGENGAEPTKEQLLERGVEVKLNKENLVELLPNGNYTHVIDVENTDIPAQLQLFKVGEKFTDTTNTSGSYKTGEKTEETVTITKAKFNDVPLQGVKYEIYANQDITTPYGTDNYADKDDYIGYMVTGEDGYATSPELHQGEYRIVEVEAPAGYSITDENGNPKQFIINMKDYTKPVDVLEFYKEDKNTRTKLPYEFKKVFEDYEYTNGKEERHAVFGVYAKEDIPNYLGTKSIKKDDMVELIEVDGDCTVESKADLPEGKYYIKELYASFPYSTSDKIVDFELKYHGNDDVVKFEVTDPIVNKPTGATVTFVKISKSTDDKAIINGNSIETTSNLDDKAQQALDEIKELDTLGLHSHYDQLKAYYEENKIIVVSGAKYEIWLDEEGTEKLYKYTPNVEDKIVATFTTDEYGLIEVTGIPRGVYYLKEVEAPTGYTVQNEAVQFIVSDDTVDTKLYQAIYDDAVIPALLHKTDIYNGENVKGCTFEISDAEGEVLVHSVTDKDGVAWIPADIFKNGEKYYYTEIDAPDVYKEDGRLYVLNTEPHEFIANIDENGKWVGEKLEVENYRPLTEVELIKTDDEGNRVPDCKFELKSVEEGVFYEVGVTDKDGIYVFKDVPKGKYIYTELEAPEEYKIDTTPHEIYVEGDKMVIEFVNTGDIPVVVLSIIALVSVVGVGYITVKKVKLSKNA